jgi:hypothetical protein
VVTKSLAMPDADCAGLDTGERFLLTRPEAREPGPEQAIRRPEPRSTVLAWLVEAADHLQTFSQYLPHDVHISQVQFDELFGVLSEVKTGQMGEAEAVECLERSPHWVWGAIDPVSKLLLAIDVGERTLAMAQRLVHHVVQYWRLAVYHYLSPTGSRNTRQHC